MPQVQALVECRLAVAGSGVPIIADGGIKRHGALAEALLFGGDCAMLGSAFAGTEEAPGEIVHKSVVLPESQKTVKVPFKVLRGMASIEAIRDRLDVEDADKVELEAIGAEGMEISVPARGSARTIVRDMIKHLCSSISYGGAGGGGEGGGRVGGGGRRGEGEGGGGGGGGEGGGGEGRLNKGGGGGGGGGMFGGGGRGGRGGGGGGGETPVAVANARGARCSRCC